jgi:Domain of unknown function (DUF4382)/Carboxypeptidase regulatory-like domain
MSALSSLKISALGLLICLVMFLTACGSSSSQSNAQSASDNQNSQLATTGVSVSDPHTCAGPRGPFSHIYVTITDVEIHASTSAGPNDPGWVDLTPNLKNSPQQIDLLAQANNQCFLASLGSTTELQPGSYQQIRIFLADNSVSVPSNQCGTSANCVILTAEPGIPLPIDISSESKTGIKIPSGQIAGGQFTIAAGQTKDLNIDFDACASIVSQGKGKGRYRLKPVLHAGEVALTSTSINGKVTDSVTGQPISGGVTIVALEQRDTAGVDRIIMETVTDSNGGFVFCPVLAGSYEVVVTAVNGQGTAYGATVITGVQPGSALGTIPLVAERGANTSPASITGQITTSTGNAGISADIVVSALQSVAVNGSNVLVTTPLAQQSMGSVLVTTASADNCPTNTDCGSYTLVVPALNPSVGAFSASGSQQPSPPAPGPVNYTVDGQAVAPDSGGLPDCSPSDMQTNFTSAGNPLSVTAGVTITASTLAFMGCQ